MEGKVFDVVRFDREMGGGVHGVHGSSYTGRRRESSKRGGRKRATGRGCTWRGRYAEGGGKPAVGGGGGARRRMRFWVSRSGSKKASVCFTNVFYVYIRINDWWNCDVECYQGRGWETSFPINSPPPPLFVEEGPPLLPRPTRPEHVKRLVRLIPRQTHI